MPSYPKQWVQRQYCFAVPIAVGIPVENHLLHSAVIAFFVRSYRQYTTTMHSCKSGRMVLPIRSIPL